MVSGGASTRVAGYLCHDDEEGVDELDDADFTDPDWCTGHHKPRVDVGEERAAEHHKGEVARDQGEQAPIASNSPETLCVPTRRRRIRKSGIRDPDEQDQREGDERDCVEEVQALERLEMMMGGRDDEASRRRAEAETEVACDPAERGRRSALLRGRRSAAPTLGTRHPRVRISLRLPALRMQTGCCRARALLPADGNRRSTLRRPRRIAACSLRLTATPLLFAASHPRRNPVSAAA
jgi:hypothetical protein